ncbi:MAG TPA: hypothetical protein RMH85_23895 [Polyangiaceae bacterium LLY-WYZ-15_(1-7)]|nr:hypothetical protein [Myxococcales bacterium]MAT26379.1 hypothetical protein [Sandaracinus sp.]HJK95095.1 hypothetical protein [Polyangiaceae bacterium LLY-WYZ-15_(1-7)]MBJ70141.1 hypothetical protein [Sandaracinus sp.]HJL04941.1 hypothetical protein [Polyangiaceae bacterium LLY-WYZ-15_(1-7)]
MLRFTLSAALLLLVACVADTGAGFVEVPVRVSGTELAPFEARDGWVVTLERADVAVGPFYFCAAEMAGDLCETARGEMLESVVIDGLDPSAREVGAMLGIEGTVRSAMHDYGLSWELTETAPRATEGAEALGGHSLVLAGVAERGEAQVRFEAAVDVVPNRAGVITVRRSLDTHELVEGDALEVRVDPRPWLEDVRFDLLAEKADEEGEPVAFEVDEQPWRAVVVGMTAGSRPELRWAEAAR